MAFMRQLGEFVGHIVAGIRADPKANRTIVSKRVEEEQRGKIVLRRTTIEEIEVREEDEDGR